MYRRYKQDVFFSTRVRIILFHIFFVSVMVFIIMELFDFSQKATLAAVAESLRNTLEGGAPNGNIIGAAIELIETTKRYVLGAIVAMSVIFGVLAVHISLKPLRDSLTLQKQFVSGIAHELRTPLAILRVENEVAALEAMPGTPFADVLARNIEEVDRITEILNNLLLLHRVQAFHNSVFEMVELGPVVRTVAARLEKLARGRGVALEVSEAPAPAIYGNATALEQAVFNVAKNAVLYSRRGDTVRLHYAAVTDEDVTLAVGDTGPGIAREDLPHVFEPFYRSASDVAKPGGTGIGLSIVLDIVKLHRGKLRVDSRPGEGTDFYITLPRRPGKPAAAADPARGSDHLTYDFTKNS